MPQSDNRPKGRALKMALELGFGPEWAGKVAEERPADVERWYVMGEVPAEEDPRLSGEV